MIVGARKLKVGIFLKTPNNIVINNIKYHIKFGIFFFCFEIYLFKIYNNNIGDNNVTSILYL